MVPPATAMPTTTINAAIEADNGTAATKAAIEASHVSATEIGRSTS
jgi:hypothetical protein